MADAPIHWREEAYDRIADLRWVQEHRRDLRPGEEDELEALEIALEEDQ